MIGIIDYGMGNLRSVYNALDLLGSEVMISSSPDELKKADKLVLPGVGAFGDGISNLRKSGLASFMQQEVIESQKPILGICLGMQLLAKEGFERGRHEGLGWIDASVRKFELSDKGLKVPHVGWNEVTFTKENPIFSRISSGNCFYFVHSYHMVCADGQDVAATCEYGYTFTASVRKGNIFGTQFHPEKSQDVGLKVLENFIDM
ncbi:MAG: imidazole glycerol phosphate synthase subunit HisH [Candidatus Micrarchaeota archaeon]